MSDFLFSTDYNYQKTALNQEDTITVAASSSTSKTYAHNLGYIPSARVWYDPDSNGTWYPLSSLQLSEGFSDFLDTTGHYYLTTTALVVTLFDATATDNDVSVIVRVYYDD